MSEEMLGEATEQPEVEQPLTPVESTEEGTVQESQEQQEEASQSNKTPEWVQRRFNEMTRDKHEAQRKSDEAKREAEHYRQLLEAVQRGDSPPSQQQAPTRQPVNDEERIRAAAAEMNKVESFNRRSNEVFNAGVAEFPDFQNALGQLQIIGVTEQFLQEVVSLDDSHKVLHALGSDPDEAMRILALPPLQQGRALERLASKPKAPTGKTVSRAPAPIGSTVGSTGSGAKDLDRVSIDEFMKARNSQANKR